jgi:hypothetical protein
MLIDFKNIFLSISVIASLITPIIGIHSILKGRYKPHRITRMIKILVSILIFISLSSMENNLSNLLAGAQLISSFAIFILSFKFGVSGKSKIDFVVLFLAIISIVLWKTTSNPVLALSLFISSDLIGMIPTIYKCFKKPGTESLAFYFSDIVSGGFSLLTIGLVNYSNFAFPLYIFILNLFCFDLIFIGRDYNSLRNLNTQS